MDFVKNEHNILKFWQENKIFEKLQKKIQGKKTWSFLDGPITANNPMGVHHAWGRAYKDLFQRYKAMQGFDQRFQNGFDCQGLWVEVEVEKELGFKNKKDIENYGIDKFVEKCKERVNKYSKIQTEQSIRLGQWMDWNNSYYTMSDENNYAIWHFLKACKQKGFLYKGKDVVPWCPRCGTAISQHEILTEEYKEISHKAIFLKFQITNDKLQTNSKFKILNSKTYFLVWTTTPWTLPGNVALAVHPDLDYAIVISRLKAQNPKPQPKIQTLNKGERFILLRNKVDLLGDNCEIIKVVKGRELRGMKYEGIFDELPAVKQSLDGYTHNVVLWKEISEEEGTGIVHIAPGCGEEDYQLAKDFHLPIIDLTDDESKYKAGFKGLSGRFVGAPETRDWIFNDLENKSRVFKIENYSHRYPTCWRCKQELIFRLVDEWYIAMDDLRKPLMESAGRISWIPEFGLDRELDWLKNMKDWLISKKRYWGLALPIFECPCGNFEVIGSKEELKERAVEGWSEFEGHSPHRPWVDKIKIKCSKCGRTISRIPDVGNPWLDAGIVPYSTMGYFSDRGFWEKWFPADFICESFPGQFKNWFYAILVMSQVLEKRPPCKTLFGYASVVDEKGEEMHKSKGNAVWFDEAVEKIGADVMRWLYARQNPVQNLRFGYNAAEEARRKLLTMVNSYAFWETYGENPKLKSQKSKIETKSQNLLDRWIISRLNRLIGQTTEFLDGIKPAQAVLAIENFFINDLSLWYIRRSRRRFQKPKNEQEKKEGEGTLYFVLLELSKLIAPIMPFLAEKFYQELKGEGMPQSVHLADWPKADKGTLNRGLEQQMEEVRNLAAKVLAKRTELGIKVRQPLLKLKIKNEKLKTIIENKELLNLIKEETNIKKIVFDEKINEEIELDTELTPELKEEGYLREVIRQIQALRKRAGLVPADKAVVYYSAEFEIESALKKNKALVLKETRSEDIKKTLNKPAGLLAEKETTIDQTRLWLAVGKAGKP